MKTCSLCNTAKSPGEFYRRSASPDGLAYRCKVCSTAAGKKWHTEHRDEANARRRARRDANIEAERARCREWKQENGEYKRALDRRYYQENAERIKAHVQEWKQANRDRVNAQSRDSYQKDLVRQRALSRAQAHRRRNQLGEPFDVACREYETVLLCDPCCYCDGVTEHIDHIEPVVGGGRNQWTNLTASCGHCNRSKRHDSLLAFLQRRTTWVSTQAGS